MSTRNKHVLRPVLEVLEDRAVPTANLTPTTFTDGLNIGSLRDQIIAANNDSDNDVITLGTGTYRLSRNGALENAALTGDLDLTTSGDTVIIQGQGVGQTVISGMDAPGN